jgi:hypothetical protein
VGCPPYLCRIISVHPYIEGLMGDLFPGGYTFTHLVFWSVVGMVAVGTNAVAIILLVGLSMMLLESVQRS